MQTNLLPHRMRAHVSTSDTVAELSVDKRDQPRIAIPLPEIRLVVRFGSAVRDGIDVHALGIREKVYRKRIPVGQRALFAPLPLNAYQAVLGVPALHIAGRGVALEDLWGDAATQRLLDQLANAQDAISAAAILDSVIAERVAAANLSSDHTQLALNAARRLASARVSAVADELGVSERHLRRVFREETGVSPKTFARLTRFRQALSAAQGTESPGWASIAAETGYYDQAHLIAEFRTIAGTTPRSLLAELNGQNA